MRAYEKESMADSLAAVLLCGCSEQGVTGEVEAVIRVQPSEAAGKVVEVPVSLGQTVKAGDVLAGA